ncbi:MAG: putative 2OG-Fe(II) oxygenase [Halieaceae bacterium]|jgi:hypothetical protein|nr:putative 2OG-Fe(II) oxygenase [Halieaceae bacterium]
MNELFNAWATPMVRKTTGRHDLAEALREVILANETPDKAHPNPPQDSHSALFESNFDFLSWQEPAVQAFKPWFYHEVGLVVQATTGFSNEKMNQLRFGCHCWFHITRAGGYFPPHNHAMASWSAIFAVDPGDEQIDNEHESGRVTFFDPRFGANMYLDAANRAWDPVTNFNSKRFRLEPTDLVVFPSYLMHSIEPYHGERPRITIAANFWFSWKTGQ